MGQIRVLCKNLTAFSPFPCKKDLGRSFPRRIDLPFDPDALPEIRCQFSQDDAVHWRRIKTGTMVTEKQTDRFWNRETQ